MRYQMLASEAQPTAGCMAGGVRGGLSLQLIFVEYPIFASDSVSSHEGHGATY